MKRTAVEKQLSELIINSRDPLKILLGLQMKVR